MFESLWGYIRLLLLPLPPVAEDLGPLVFLTAPETQLFVPSQVCATLSPNRNKYHIRT